MHIITQALEKIFMFKLKLPVVKQVALASGVPASGTKASLVAAINRQIEFFRRRAGPILGIDIGIKHFSYCVVDNQVLEWHTVNLDDVYGPGYAQTTPPVDTRRYLAYLVDCLHFRLTRHQPAITVVETQRSQSNGNQRTLPTVLNNIRLEALLIGRLYPGLVIPMTLAQMSSFWLHRFFEKSLLPKTSKLLRAALVQQMMGASLRELTEMAGFPKKIDDAVDSLLYAKAVVAHRQFCHSIDGVDDEQEILHRLDEAHRHHFQLVLPLINHRGSRGQLQFTELAAHLAGNMPA